MSKKSFSIPSVNDALLFHKIAYEDYINKHGSISKTEIDDVNKNFLLVNIKRIKLCKMIFSKMQKKDIDNIEMFVKKFDEVTCDYLDILDDAVRQDLIKEEFYLASCENAKLIKERIDDIVKV
jgi:hypothetical protein